MEKVIPFGVRTWYEPLVFTPKLKSSNEEEDIKNIDGVALSCTRIEKEEPIDLKGVKDSPQREAGDMTYAS
jgi:hypothetical protein